MQAQPAEEAPAVDWELQDSGVLEELGSGSKNQLVG